MMGMKTSTEFFVGSIQHRTTFPPLTWADVNNRSWYSLLPYLFFSKMKPSSNTKHTKTALINLVHNIYKIYKIKTATLSLCILSD